MISLLISSQFFELSDGVIAMGASMQHIFPIIHTERNPKAHTTTEKAEPTSKKHLKITNAFSSPSEDFCIAVRTSCPDRIGSYHMSHLFRVYQTKFSDFLILNWL